ncbi:MAG: hypothetical protein ACREDR_45040 [Blastocatellia bacterium]
MRYLSASAAVLGAAMVASFIPLGRTARATDAKPVVKSILDRNTIAGPSSSFPSTITYSIKRYMTPPKLLEGLAEINPVTCKEVSAGAWTIITATQDCRNVKCGTVTTGTETVTIPSGVCAGSTFTFATIYYEWTAHNNQSTLPAPPNSVADTFNATWTAPDGNTEQLTFDINVPVVRPDRETTAFGSWYYTRGLWQQTLVPPDTDSKFDFSGEQVREFAAAPAGPDTCWFVGSGSPLVSVTNDQTVFWTVESGNVYGPDKVGYYPRVVFLYREHSPTFKRNGFCGTMFGQQMKIHAPSDPPDIYTEYGGRNTGNVNLLGASMRGNTVTSTRAGMPATEGFP